MTASIFCDLRGVSADEAKNSFYWLNGEPHMQRRFDELWPGAAVSETVTEEVRNLGEGRSEVVTVIEWKPADG